jgi:hypothetical protein
MQRFIIQACPYSIVYNKFAICDGDLNSMGRTWTISSHSFLLKKALAAIATGGLIAVKGNKALAASISSTVFLSPHLQNSYKMNIYDSTLKKQVRLCGTRNGISRYAIKVNDGTESIDIRYRFSRWEMYVSGKKDPVVTWPPLRRAKNGLIRAKGFTIRILRRGEHREISFSEVETIELVRNDMYEITVDTSIWPGLNRFLPVLMAYIMRSQAYVSKAVLLPLAIAGYSVAYGQIQKILSANRTTEQKNILASNPITAQCAVVNIRGGEFSDKAVQRPPPKP